MIAFLLDTSTSQAAGGGPPQWVVLALAAATILYIAVIRPMRKGKPSKDPLKRPPSQTTLAQQRAVERDMGNLLVEYEGMIRRMTAQVDTRATKLEMLIREADDRIAQLKAIAGPVAVNPAAAPSDPPSAVPLVPAGGAELPEAVPTPPEPVARPHDAVYLLADKGQTSRQIAQQLQQHVGEVELILALRGPRQREPQAHAAAVSGAPGQTIGGALGPDEAEPMESTASNESNDTVTGVRGKGRRKPRYSTK